MHLNIHVPALARGLLLAARAGLLELRVPWDLLNVTDPSSRTLLFDDRVSGAFGTAEAKDFHFGIVTYEKKGQPEVIAVASAFDRSPGLVSAWDIRDCHSMRPHC
jgi:hypothetical protein